MEKKRLVIKVGTSTLLRQGGGVNLREMDALARVLSDLKNMGHQVILVSSGAIGVGAGKLGLKERPTQLRFKQAAAAAGQCELMHLYDKFFGEYGQTVKPMNQEIIDKVIPGEKRITCRPADLIENEMDKLEAEMKEWKQQDEDVLSYALFPQVATDFFKYRQAQQEKVDMTQADTKNGAYPV